MKRTKVQLILTGFLLCAAVLPALGVERSGEEVRLETAAKGLDKKNSAGRTRVIDRIKAHFGVDSGLVQTLRYRKMRYGEISIALALAQEMPGGITDENLHKVVALRQGPPVAGWSKIARDLGLKLGPAITKVRQMSDEVRQKEKSDKAKKDKKTKRKSMNALKKRKKSGQTEQDENAGYKSMTQP